MQQREAAFEQARTHLDKAAVAEQRLAAKEAELQAQQQESARILSETGAEVRRLRKAQEEALASKEALREKSEMALGAAQRDAKDEGVEAAAPQAAAVPRRRREARAEILVMLDGAHLRAVPGHCSRHLEVTVGKVETAGRPPRRFALAPLGAVQPAQTVTAALLAHGWQPGRPVTAISDGEPALPNLVSAATQNPVRRILDWWQHLGCGCVVSSRRVASRKECLAPNSACSRRNSPVQRSGSTCDSGDNDTSNMPRVSAQVHRRMRGVATFTVPNNVWRVRVR